MRLVLVVLSSIGMLAAAGPNASQEASVSEQDIVGHSIFKTYCATCHGTNGKGDGRLAQHLRTVPPDLTRLAERSKGKFDAEKVQRIVDGREPVKGHGGPDMPVWGDAFRQSRDGYSEARVKERIRYVVEFLESVQVQTKP